MGSAIAQACHGSRRARSSRRRPRDSLSRRTNLVYGNGTTQAMSYSPGSDLLTLAHGLSGTGATYTNTYTRAHQLLTEVASNASWQYLPALFETTTYGAANAMNQYVVVTQGANPTVTLIGACPGRGFAETRGCQRQSHQRWHLGLCL